MDEDDYGEVECRNLTSMDPNECFIRERNAYVLLFREHKLRKPEVGKRRRGSGAVDGQWSVARVTKVRKYRMQG